MHSAKRITSYRLATDVSVVQVPPDTEFLRYVDLDDDGLIVVYGLSSEPHPAVAAPAQAAPSGPHPAASGPQPATQPPAAQRQLVVTDDGSMLPTGPSTHVGSTTSNGHRWHVFAVAGQRAPDMTSNRVRPQDQGGADDQ